MRCVLPWLDRWAAKKPDAAAFEGDDTMNYNYFEKSEAKRS